MTSSGALKHRSTSSPYTIGANGRAVIRKTRPDRFLHRSCTTPCINLAAVDPVWLNKMTKTERGSKRGDAKRHSTRGGGKRAGVTSQIATRTGVWAGLQGEGRTHKPIDYTGVGKRACLFKVAATECPRGAQAYWLTNEASKDTAGRSSLRLEFPLPDRKSKRASVTTTLLWYPLYDTYAIRMLLIGMWMSLTKKPMNPMTRNPTVVALATCINSARKRTKGQRMQVSCGVFGKSAINREQHAFLSQPR